MPSLYFPCTTTGSNPNSLQAFQTLSWLLRGIMIFLPWREATYIMTMTPQVEPSVRKYEYFTPRISAMSRSASSITPEGLERLSEYDSSVTSRSAMGNRFLKLLAALWPGTWKLFVDLTCFLSSVYILHSFISASSSGACLCGAAFLSHIIYAALCAAFCPVLNGICEPFVQGPSAGKMADMRA